MYGKGRNFREWIYVLDHCKALYKIYQSGKKNERYNIGSNLNFRNIEIAKKIILISKKKKIFNNKSKISYISDRPGHDFRYALNSNKLRKKLGWSHKVSINNGLYRTIEWYKENKLFYKFVRNKNYSNRIGKKR